MEELPLKCVYNDGNTDRNKLEQKGTSAFVKFVHFPLPQLVILYLSKNGIKQTATTSAIGAAKS